MVMIDHVVIRGFDANIIPRVSVVVHVSRNFRIILNSCETLNINLNKSLSIYLSQNLRN